MAGPSDDFFRDVVATVGGELASKLPDVEKRRTAAKALGQNLTLADVAVKMGLLDEAKRGELARLEGGDAAAAEPEPAEATPSPMKSTPSSSKKPAAAAKVPSKARVPAAAKASTPAKPVARATPEAPAPAAPADPGALTECIQCNNTLAAGSDPEGTGLCATCRGEAESLGEEEAEAPTKSASRGTKRRARVGTQGSPSVRPGPPASNKSMGPLLIMGAMVGAAAIVAVAIILKGNQVPPEVVASPSPSVRPASPSPVAVEASPEPSPVPSPPRQSHKAKLTEMAIKAINYAHAGDKTAAKKQLARLRLDATETDDEKTVKEAEKQVDQELAAAAHASASPEPTNLDPTGHRIPPKVDGDTPDDPTPTTAASPSSSNPNEASSRVAYRDWRTKFDPVVARFDLDGARTILSQAPTFEGSAAQDFADDKQIPDVLDRFLAMAGRGAKKAVNTSQDLHTAAGARIHGKVTDVDGLNITINTSGGDQLVKVSELVTEELIGFATQGYTKDSQQDYALGRGLCAYYACDLEGAKPSLAGSTTTLGKHIVERISLEGAPKVGPRAKGPAPKAGNKPTPKPEDNPAPDDSGGTNAISPADLAALQAMVAARVSDEGDGRIGIRYSCTNDGEPADFDSRGCDVFEVKKTEKPGTYSKEFTDLECGISSNDDIAILHKIPFKGDIEFSIEFWVNYMHDSNSNLTFVIGHDKKRWLGAAFGQQLWRSDGKTRPKAGSSSPPELSKFGQARDCVVKISRKGDVLKVTFNGAECGTMTGASGYDGKWGILAHNLKIGIRRMEIHGVPDLKK